MTWANYRPGEKKLKKYWEVGIEISINNNTTSHQIYTKNQLHNILRLFDALPSFPFATGETMGDYYL